MALIGSPVGHSGSPAMYNYSFARLGLDYAYVALDIKEDEVKDAIAAMKLFHMKGGNVRTRRKLQNIWMSCHRQRRSSERSTLL
jgi:shikimate dehydrogenase